MSTVIIYTVLSMLQTLLLSKTLNDSLFVTLHKHYSFAYCELYKTAQLYDLREFKALPNCKSVQI